MSSSRIYPVVSDHLTHIGQERVTGNVTHRFEVRVAGIAPYNGSICHGDDVRRPWLFPCCSCGWASTESWTIEENAYYHWVHHVEQTER